MNFFKKLHTHTFNSNETYYKVFQKLIKEQKPNAVIEQKCEGCKKTIYRSFGFMFSITNNEIKCICKNDGFDDDWNPECPAHGV